MRISHFCVRLPSSNLISTRLMCSSKSKCVTNMDALRFSEYVEECCEQLHMDGISSDRHLVHLVRLQQIVEKFELVRHSLLRSSQSRLCTPGSLGGPSSSGTTFVANWESQLAGFWDSVPFIAKTGEIIWLFEESTDYD